MKTILNSKTMWFGIAQIAFAILGIVIGQMEPDQALTLVVTGFGTIGFRFATSKPIQ